MKINIVKSNLKSQKYVFYKKKSIIKMKAKNKSKGNKKNINT